MADMLITPSFLPPKPGMQKAVKAHNTMMAIERDAAQPFELADSAIPRQQQALSAGHSTKRHIQFTAPHGALAVARPATGQL